MISKSEVIRYYNLAAPKRDYWIKRNWYYHRHIERFVKLVVGEDARNSKEKIIEIGCGTGELLSKLGYLNAVGIDISEEMIKIASSKNPTLKFFVDDIEDLKTSDKFKYVIMQDLLGTLSDVWATFRNLQKITDEQSVIVITYYNHLWEPIILLAEWLGFKMRQPYQNWLSLEDIKNLLYLNDYEVLKSGYMFLFPIYIPLISEFINKYIAPLPFIRKMCLIKYIIAKESITIKKARRDYSVSVVIPCRNERGNIEDAIRRMPFMGKKDKAMEVIFVDGDSTDGTVEKIQELIKVPPRNEIEIKLIPQQGAYGKADAVHKGFDAAGGEVLMILDADLTVPPEDLERFYLAISEGKGEFINGSRLVYPMEKRAMRLLNMLGNKTFSILFTWILEQRIKDTLCGTKVLFKKDYERIKSCRKYFGDFDPFGDFELLFGASKLNLKIVEIPVRYRERKYGVSKIRRFYHGLLLFKMCWLAFKKFKMM